MSRAIGETMIVALAAGAQKNFSLDPREGMQTMTGFIAQTAGGESPVGSLSYNTLFAVGLLLFLITLVLNLISIGSSDDSGRSTDECRHVHRRRAAVTTTIATGKSRDRNTAVVGVPDRCCGSPCSSASSCCWC